MNTRSRLLHVILLLSTGALGAAVDYATGSHSVWAPVLVALLTELRTIAGTNGAPPPALFPPGPVVALVLAALVASGCSGTTLPPPVVPVVNGIVDCAEQATHEAALHLVDDVASALVGGDWQAALTDLVTRFGEAAVDCAVREVAGTSGHNAQATSDEVEAAKAQRGRDWLAARKITFR